MKQNPEMAYPDDAESLMESIIGSKQGSLLAMLAKRAELHGGSTFLNSYCQGAEGRWTFSDALELILKVAAGWRSLGVETGTRVASFVNNSPDAIWAWLGAQAAGATFIPLNRHLTGPLLKDQIWRSGARFLVTDASGLEVLEKLGPLDVVPVLTDPETSRGATHFEELKQHEAGELVLPNPSDVGFITFTSGSTGRSKAVRLPHNTLIRSACAYASNTVLKLDRRDVLFGWNPLFHLGALVPLAAASGAECALFDRFSASNFWNQVVDCGATYVEGYPVMIDYLLKQPPRAIERQHKLRWLFVAGFDSEMHRKASERFGIAITNNVYDMSETGVVLANSPDEPSPPGSCGRCSPGWEVAIEDEGNVSVAGEAAGQLLVRPTRPDIIFQGYEQDAETTVTAWRDLWFHTGDRFFRNDAGDFFYQGRLANRIRRRGENVSEEELSTLLQSHPDVEKAIVVGVRSDKGEDDIKVAIIPRVGGNFEVRMYVGWCSETVPRHMMPRYFEVLDDVPRLASGKPDLQRLRTITAETADVERVAASA